MPDRGSGKLPQWWLDNTPHDTLEDQIEREEKKEAERIAKAEAQAQAQAKAHDQAKEEEEGSDAAANGVPPAVTVDPRFDGGGGPQPEILKPGYVRTTSPMNPADFVKEYEKADYNYERAKLKPTGAGENGESSRGSSNHAYLGEAKHYVSGEGESREQAIPSPVPSNLNDKLTSDTPGSTDVLSPMSQASEPFSDNSLTSPFNRQPRQFKTAFTGVSPFDFAMQQRAREQERREKERFAREALARHHADEVEVVRVSENKAKHMEQRRKKKEAEENLKGFKKVTLDDNFDKASELKRQQQEHKKQKKQAEEKHHEYKGS